MTDQLPAKLEDQLLAYEPQFRAVLPAHIPVEKFRRVILTAINLNPDLMHADRRSLFNACVKAATDGVYPDGRQAALVIYNTNVGTKTEPKWEKRVQYLPMIAGIRQRMHNSGEVKSAEAHVVYERDQFAYELGDDPKLMHRPALRDRGALVCVYAIIRLANGEVLREVMGVDDIERARAVSRAKDRGPWVEWYGEMARKTVLRRCAKAAPMAAEIDIVLHRDDELEADELPPPARPQRIDYKPPAPIPAEVEAKLDAEQLAEVHGRMPDTAEERGDAPEPAKAQAPPSKPEVSQAAYEAIPWPLMSSSKQSGVYSNSSGFVSAILADLSAVGYGPKKASKLVADNAAMLTRLEATDPENHARVIEAARKAGAE